MTVSDFTRAGVASALFQTPADYRVCSPLRPKCKLTNASLAVFSQAKSACYSSYGCGALQA